ncbi:MAG: hypothetical protein RLZZ293_1245 [Pseudomonadota bacterium]|jgi:tRNA threonylcarbamoyladenosine biosynthesis protein TsaE
MKYTQILDDLTATENLAQHLAKILKPNFIINLSGNLATGKTTLTRAILQHLGVGGTIKSPTFTLVEPYQLDGYILYHFDLYRFSDPEEWFSAGFDEYFHQQHISIIEWPERAEQLIPQADWHIQLVWLDDNKRQISINSLTKNGEICLKQLINNDAI